MLKQSWGGAVLMLAAACSPSTQVAELAKPTSATGRTAVEALLTRISQGEREKDFSTIRDSGWPGATFSIRGFGEPLAQASQRAWDEPIFIGSGVSSQVRYSPPRIAWASDRAFIEQHGTGGFLCQNSEGDFIPDGSHFREYNSIVIERRDGQWRVATWERAIQDLPPTSVKAVC